VVLRIRPFPATKRAQRYTRAWGEPRKKVLKTSMGQFSFVQNERFGVGDSIVFSAPGKAYLQGNAADGVRSGLFFTMPEVGAVCAVESRCRSPDTCLDTILGYSKQCGDRHFAGVAQAMRYALSVADLPLEIAGAGRDEPLRGEGWAGGNNARAPSNGVCAGLPGLGGYIRMRNDAGGIAEYPDEAKEIDCYA